MEKYIENMSDCYKDGERWSNKQYWAGVYPFYANVLHFVLLRDGNDSVGNDNLLVLGFNCQAIRFTWLIWSAIIDKLQPHNEIYSLK